MLNEPDEAATDSRLRNAFTLQQQQSALCQKIIIKHIQCGVYKVTNCDTMNCPLILL